MARRQAGSHAPCVHSDEQRVLGAGQGQQIGRKPTTRDGITAVFYPHDPAYAAGQLYVSKLAMVCGIGRPPVYRYICLEDVSWFGILIFICCMPIIRKALFTYFYFPPKPLAFTPHLSQRLSAGSLCFVTSQGITCRILPVSSSQRFHLHYSFI